MVFNTNNSGIEEHLDEIIVEQLLAREPQLIEYINFIPATPATPAINMSVSFIQSCTFSVSVFGKTVL
jgi:hypothetical protein